MIEFVFVGGVAVGIAAITVRGKHFLSLLLMFELSMLSLFGLAVFGFSSIGMIESSFLLVSMGACEAAIGLGLLISLARTTGNDVVAVALMIST